MRVRVKLYSIFRDAVGKPEVEVELEKGSYGELIEKLARFDGIARALRALEGSFVVIDESGERLEESGVVKGGVVHLMPLPSGGELSVSVRVLEKEAVDLNDVVEELKKPGVGAIALFVGVVKPESGGERVEELVYEYSPELLEKSLEKIAREVGEKWGLKSIAIMHYVGRRKPGETTIVIGVAGASRKNALPALSEALERVKHEAPIFKVEVRESGRVYIVGERAVRPES